ncbi:GGDEF domain-containing protein [Alteromonas naphthalenivorans]|uniref:GGDEF domain-containing protein n=1 Tax=Alteromonas naphthalenivorans TaxID=715451 RepID=UPI001E561CA5|nr:GGDEF domain-containing protein [Alteromonas naphthalenivorans]
MRQFLKSNHQNDAEIKRRRLTLYFISYVGGTIMAVLAIQNVFRGDHLLAFFLGLFSVSVYGNAVLSHLYNKNDIFYYLAGALVIVMISTITITGGYHNTGLYFVFPLICIQIIVVQFRAAIVYVSVTMLLVFLIVSNQDVIPASYRPEDVSRFLISLSCFIAVFFIGEYFWHQSRKEMMSDNLEKMRQAHTDPLTKIPNRRFLESVYFERAINNPVDYFPLSAVVVDVDFFKKINDTYGHDVGDKVLIHLAQIMRSAIRSTDLVSRTGGEEFLIIYPATPLSVAVKLAEKIRIEIESTPFEDGDIRHPLTSSFGVATALADVNVEAAIKLADDNLYEAKRTGRNCVV